LATTAYPDRARAATAGCHDARQRDMDSRKVTRQQLLTVLQELGRAPGEWVSVYLRPTSVQARPAGLVLESRVDPRLLEIASLIEDEPLQREIARFGTGLVLFHGGATIAVAPAFPVEQDEVVIGRPHVGPLLEKVQQPRRTVLVLATWGAYVVALFDGEELVRYKKGTGHIHPPHKKGGSSQARFARRTENQRADFLRRVGGHIDEELGTERVEHIFFGGNRLILRPLTGESRFLRDHVTAVSPRTLLVKRATLDTMTGALADAYSAMLLHA